MKIEDRLKVGTGPDWLRSREGCAWDRSSLLRSLPLTILPQARRQNPAPSKNGGVHFARSSCAKHTPPFLRARTPFPSATANPAQFRRAFT